MPMPRNPCGKSTRERENGRANAFSRSPFLLQSTETTGNWRVWHCSAILSSDSAGALSKIQSVKTALVVYGGWEGHEPRPVAELLAGALRRHGVEVTLADTLDAFRDLDPQRPPDLIVPVWTMGAITAEQLRPLLAAVRQGSGLAGCHGGMCDAFRNETEYHFMTGGQWVAHPGNDGRLYRVNIVDANPITEGVNDFDVVSEKYYMHVDPAIRVLATTTFEDYGDCVMPVAWTKTWGRGRVFYCSLGHHADIVAMPQTLALMTRGMRWAAGEWQTELGLPFARVCAN